MKKLLLVLVALLIAACNAATPPTGQAPAAATAVPIAPTHMVAPNLAPPVTEITVGPITGSAGNRKDVVCAPPILLVPSDRFYTGAVVVDVTVDKHYGKLFGLPSGAHILFSGELTREKLQKVAGDLEVTVYAMTDSVCGAQYISQRIMETNTVAAPWETLIEPIKEGEQPMVTFTD